MRVKREGTGFFRVEQVNGRWFFITPEGHPYIALGANHMGPFLRNQARQTGLWKRYGGDYAQTAAGFLKVIQDLGLTAGEVYDQEETYKRTLPWITFFWYGPRNDAFIDVFDAGQMESVKRRAHEHAKSVADNPWVLGIGGPDLNIWDSKLVRRYRRLPPEAEGRKRYLGFLRQRHPGGIAEVNATYRTDFSSFEDLAARPEIVYPSDAVEDGMDPWVLRWKLTEPPEQSANPPAKADDDAFSALVAATLFSALRPAVKAGAPNHLFLGEHLALRMVPDTVVKTMAKYVDAYMAQAVEVSPQRPPEWQLFQAARWDHEFALAGKPIVICDWGAVFSYGEPFENKGAVIKSEKEASDDSARFIGDAFERPYIIGLFLCKLLGDHPNDARFFDNRATRTYMKGDGTSYPYRTNRLKQANLEAQKKVYDRAAAGEGKRVKP